jgi:hypothetical protein
VCFIVLKKCKGLLVSSQLIKTPKLEQFLAEVKIVMRRAKYLVESVSNSVLLESIIGICCTIKEGGFGFLDKWIINWV